jgi:hypothetical protein
VLPLRVTIPDGEADHVAVELISALLPSLYVASALYVTGVFEPEVLIEEVAGVTAIEESVGGGGVECDDPPHAASTAIIPRVKTSVTCFKRIIRIPLHEVTPAQITPGQVVGDNRCISNPSSQSASKTNIMNCLPNCYILPGHSQLRPLSPIVKNPKNQLATAPPSRVSKPERIQLDKNGGDSARNLWGGKKPSILVRES